MKKREVRTLSEVAELARVSESTASRALAGSPLVAEKTRKHVLQIAKLCNYVVNQNARNLRLKQTNVIEVVSPVWQNRRKTIADPFFLELLGAIGDNLNAKGYDLLLSTQPPWNDDWQRNPLMTGKADGIILIGQGASDPMIHELANDYPQVVVWGADIPYQPYCVVGSDNVEGGRLATEHLISVGRQSIAFLGDIKMPEIGHRHEGYRKALAEAGRPYDPDLTFSVPFDVGAVHNSALELVNSGKDFDAVFATSDVIAMSLISELIASGRSVPEDVAVVGFDNVSSSALYNPGLTTIAQDMALGGKLLVEKVLARAAGEEQGSTLMPVKLIVRSSCGVNL